MLGAQYNSFNIILGRRPMAGDYKGAQPPYQAENRAKRGLLSLLIIMRRSTKRALIRNDGRDATLSSKLSAYNGRITGNVCAVDIDATKEVQLHSHKI